MCLAKKLKAMFSPSEPRPSPEDLKDLGLLWFDYDLLMRSQPGTRARMEGMAHRFGLEPADLDKDRDVLMEVAESCGQCRWARACHDELTGKGQFDELACPNAIRYLEMSAS